MQNILTSWKEIAQYLGKGVRTVQRWEVEYALPVRRPKDGKHKAVLAIPEEIDAWARRQELAGKGAVYENEIESLRSAVASLKAENAALRFRLNALDPVGMTREMPEVHTALSAGNGRQSRSDDQGEAAHKSSLDRPTGNGRARKHREAVARMGIARNGAAGVRAQALLVEDVEQFLRTR